MHYDGVNYAIFKIYPPDQTDESFIDKIDPRFLAISSWQKKALKDLLEQLEKKYPEDALIEIIQDIKKSIDNSDTQQIIKSITESATIQRVIMVDA